MRFQSTRPVRARPYLHQKLNYSSLISIHAPRAGATQAWFSQTTANNLFQSTRPVRGATVSDCHNLGRSSISIRAPRAGRDLSKYSRKLLIVLISIRAPRAGRDIFSTLTFVNNINFNPRAPCGARLFLLGIQSSCKLFQSARPVRGATTNFALQGGDGTFQSARPVRGATLRFLPMSPPLSLFQSARPVRGATPPFF